MNVRFYIWPCSCLRYESSRAATVVAIATNLKYTPKSS